MLETEAYRPGCHVRFVTAAALFDGHDASINIMRRILQASGVEVIHLGHNRSVTEVVRCAIQEDVQGIAISSYQGGHIEYLEYMYDLLQQEGAGHIRIFAGGGGVIVPSEIEQLHRYGITRVFSPDDGRAMGLQGMINHMVRLCDFKTPQQPEQHAVMLKSCDWGAASRLITLAEEQADDTGIPGADVLQQLMANVPPVPVVGITGTGGAGKSSLTDELVRRFLDQYPERSIAVLSVDPTKLRSGGALLGDRIRMNAVHHPNVYMRSMATRGSKSEISAATKDAIHIMKHAGCDLVIIETSGIGQGSSAVVDLCDISVYVMTSEYGASSQLEKIDMIDFADIIVLNKFDRRGSEDALLAVRKQYKRSRQLFDAPDEELPVFGTIASQFNDLGTTMLFLHLMKAVGSASGVIWPLPGETLQPKTKMTRHQRIIPPERTGYLAEIVHTVRDYKRHTEEQSELAGKLASLTETKALIESNADADSYADADTDAVKDRDAMFSSADRQQLTAKLDKLIAHYEMKIDPDSRKRLTDWRTIRQSYRETRIAPPSGVTSRTNETSMYAVTLSGTRIARISLPTFTDDGDVLRWLRRENLPGYFPYTAGVFPFKRTNEDPRRQFAGEGTPERTNRRFHLLSGSDEATRLSTAFDSVTLYGQDPELRPDIYGKIGNSGVSVCTLDDMKKLFHGFDLCGRAVSVSMTINGPAPILLAMYMNTAIDQQVEQFIMSEGREPNEAEFEKLRSSTLQTVRGTVQADILKEDQGQNTCIFSTEFAMKMMGDIQQYFVEQRVRHYYSVSISGYHIAEAGANPITQLAFTLANGFTYVEYYLSRGMKIDQFAPNLSFFFSNGLDPEYSVMGRVARRIWAIVIRDKYGGSERSQKLKYHIQTSGRSLHAQEMDFNDIRTTLQALIAIYDNCNSLHTNAYDEAVTTPTEHSVRRAMAIQMIINKEFGMTKNENPLQGSFAIEELTDLVEEAVLAEFQRIHERGGVLGAMETEYQRSKIQEESLHYEHMKHTGELPIIGVNTFIQPDSDETPYDHIELARSTDEEKQTQLRSVAAFKVQHQAECGAALERLKQAARTESNVFEALMDTVRHATLGQITNALYDVGGQYRRNM